MYKKYVLIAVLALFFSVFFIAPHVQAQNLSPIAPTPTPCVTVMPGSTTPSPCIIVDQRQLGFRIPSFSEILTFAVRAIFVFAGLAALFFLLQGAFAWITSGGEKDAIAKAQAKIQAAVLGVIMIAVVLAIAVTLEQVVFARKICFGLSCPITIPSLLKDPNTPYNPAAPAQFQLLDEDTPTPVPTLSSVTPTLPSPPATGGEIVVPTATPLPPNDELTPHPYR
jgi:hypothetical protein